MNNQNYRGPNRLFRIAARICLVLLFCLAAGGSGFAADGFRTDINPALQYYQAFLVAPDLPPADRAFVFDTQWRGQKLPDRLGELLSRYDNQLRFARHAAQATVPCEWGIDLSPGPATLLPHLARNKAIAQAARLRAMWALQNGKQTDARDDLLAAFALGRNCSRDGTIIAALVQIAIENIVCSTIAENFYQFSPETLRELEAGIESAPPRGTMAAAMMTERASFHDWLINRVLDLQKEAAGNDAKVMAGIQEVFRSVEDTDGPRTNHWDEINHAANGTSAGVLRLLRDEDPYYLRLTEIMALPRAAYEPQVKEFYADVRKSSNPLVPLFFPALEKARNKELAIQAALGMLHAAIEYRVNGDAGLQSVPDPLGQGPFAFERFSFQGVDRGFLIKSSYDGRGFPEVLIFVEKDGPPFRVAGADAGKPVAP